MGLPRRRVDRACNKNETSLISDHVNKLLLKQTIVVSFHYSFIYVYKYNNILH